MVSIPTCARGRSQSVADAGQGKPLGPDHLGNIGDLYIQAEPAQTGLAFVARGFTGFAFGSIPTRQPAATELQAKRNADTWKD